METITLGQLLEAVEGRLLGGLTDLETPILRVDTDSRTIHPGALFIPLIGERFDGHAYINSALEGGGRGLSHPAGAGELPPGQILCEGGRHPESPAGSGRLVQEPV